VTAAFSPGGFAGGPMLEVRDLHVQIATRRGTVRAVDGVSFEVPRGEALGLVGESGSGKSMTLRSILGVLPPEAAVTAGQIMLDGQDLVPLGQNELNRIRGPKMSMIFQEPMSALNPVMRVGAQIAEGPMVHQGLSRGKAAERALDLMRRVGIPHPERRMRSYPHEFSGGMRQRVMIAIALARTRGDPLRRADQRAGRDHPGPDPCGCWPGCGSPGEPAFAHPRPACGGPDRQQVVAVRRRVPAECGGPDVLHDLRHPTRSVWSGPHRTSTTSARLVPILAAEPSSRRRTAAGSPRCKLADGNRRGDRVADEAVAGRRALLACPRIGPSRRPEPRRAAPCRRGRVMSEQEPPCRLCGPLLTTRNCRIAFRGAAARRAAQKENFAARGRRVDLETARRGAGRVGDPGPASPLWAGR
jgi:ABC-type polar amino acid transport system ATPase subunit